MSGSENSFDDRLRRVVRKHRRMANNGVVHRMGPDGLVMEYPRRRMPRFPLRAIVILLAVAFLFKAWMLASVGTVEYGQRVTQLAEGSQVEKAAAWVMQVDPATQFVAGLMGAQ